VKIPVRKNASRFRRWLKRLGLGAGILCTLAAGVFTFCWFAFPFPIERLSRWPASARAEDRAGGVMLERVAADDQWRFPVRLPDVSPWLAPATIAVEDRRFRSHAGVDPRAVLRAVGQNVRSLRVVSGASTLTMQVCRMMDERPRNLWSKAVESFRALQLERLRSKDEILELYFNVAPYGRNLRGVEAASRAYFGKGAKDLSLGEAALLAGLPQSPSRHRPDEHPEAARARRSAVLKRMAEERFISDSQRRLAETEPIVVANALHPGPAGAPAWMALRQRPGGGRTTIDTAIQKEVERLLRARAGDWPAGTDAAAVVLDVATGELLALVGGVDPNDPADGQVNGATAWRSPGSALKPFVYACAFESKRLAPDSTVYDVPIQRAGWAPANFDRRFSGPLPAAEALRRSLNVPAILIAEAAGVGRCAGAMESAGVVFRRSPQERARILPIDEERRLLRPYRPAVRPDHGRVFLFPP
jgi:penicillin-binding protein 1C